jgi:hypothetical protein
MPVLKEVDKYLLHNAPRAAEKVLRKALQDFAEPKNSDASELFLSRLVWAYSLFDPPRFDEIERILFEMEEIWPGARSSMQTANLILGHLKDDQRAIRKFREVVNMGKAEGELRIPFHALSTLGLALLKLGKGSEVVEILDEMEEMIPLADLHVGSEAMFLQELFQKTNSSRQSGTFSRAARTSCAWGLARTRDYSIYRSCWETLTESDSDLPRIKPLAASLHQK